MRGEQFGKRINRILTDNEIKFLFSQNRGLCKMDKNEKRNADIYENLMQYHFGLSMKLYVLIGQRTYIL